MKFLIDADMPRLVASTVRSYDHEAYDVRDIGLASAPDDQIAAYAKDNNLCLITGDWGFADIRNYPPEQYPGLVIVHVPRNATAKAIGLLVESFLKMSPLVEQLRGHLAIVEVGKLRVRPPLS